MLEDESVSIQRVGEIVKEVLNIIDEDAPASALAGIKQQFKKNNNYLFFFISVFVIFIVS
ncbi:MAG: hypothetical protein WCR60_03405 [Patescibacteria group bacterium]